MPVGLIRAGLPILDHACPGCIPIDWTREYKSRYGIVGCPCPPPCLPSHSNFMVITIMIVIIKICLRSPKMENCNLRSCGEQRRGETPFVPHGCCAKRLGLSVRIRLRLHHTRTRPRTSLVQWYVSSSMFLVPQTSTTSACCARVQTGIENQFGLLTLHEPKCIDVASTRVIRALDRGRQITVIPYRDPWPPSDTYARLTQNGGYAARMISTCRQVSSMYGPYV